jgi:hypothetical protein
MIDISLRGGGQSVSVHSPNVYPFTSAFLCFFFTTGLIVSANKISLLVLQSCHVFFAVFLVNFNFAAVILDLSSSQIA